MYTLSTFLVGHELRLSETQILASGSVAFDTVHFDFDDNWAGLSKVALFWGADGNAYGSMVDAEGNAAVPWEALADAGRIKFGVYGVTGSGDNAVRATSTLIHYKLPEGAWTEDGQQPTPAEQTIIEQAIAAIQSAVENLDREPIIRDGIWYTWDIHADDYVSTGVAATGPQGPQGQQGPTGDVTPAAQQAVSDAQAAAAAAAGSATDAAGSASAASGSAAAAATSAQNAEDTAAEIEQKLDSTSAYGEVGPVPIASIPDALPLDAVKLVVDIEPVQSGSGDPSPTNVRPISNWAGANVTRTGKNLWGFGDQSFTREKTFNFQTPIPAGTYMFSAVVTSTAPDTCNIVFLDGDGGTYSKYISHSSSRTSITSAFVTTKPITMIALRSARNYSESSGIDATYADIQLELGSAATSYEPYQGNTYNITFPSAAGTVYGGTLDMVNGKLQVYPYFASYNGETLVGPWISSMDKYVEGATPTIGAQVVDMGGTPITYDLTPQQIALLRGNNTIFADCGNTTVGFWRDDSLSINKAIAERAYGRQQGEALADKLDATQSDIAIIIEGNQTTHTGGVAVGEYVIVRNSAISGITDGLYKAVQAIPANTAIDSTYLAAVDGGGLNELNASMIKVATVSGTTSAGGNISTNGDVTDFIVISAYSSSGDNIVPWLSKEGVWYLRAINESGGTMRVVTNTQMTITYLYIDA